MSVPLPPPPSWVRPLANLRPLDPARAMHTALRRFLLREYQAKTAPRPKFRRWRERPTSRIVTP